MGYDHAAADGRVSMMADDCDTRAYTEQEDPRNDHSTCRTRINTFTGEVECIGHHCPACGAPTDEFGHHSLSGRGDDRG